MATFRVPVRISHAGGGGDAYNIMHFRTIGPSLDDQDQLNTGIVALRNLYDGIRDMYASTTTIHIAEAVIKDPLGSPEYFDSDSFVVTGSRVGGVEPTLLAVCATWRTTSATRSGRGRTFFGPLGTGLVAADGTPDNGDLGVLRSSISTFLNRSQGPEGWSFGVLSTKQRLFRDVTAYTVRDRFAYLSSRRD
jgi:hypothetical protein